MPAPATHPPASRSHLATFREGPRTWLALAATSAAVVTEDGP
jgi:hypothetical protein